MKEELLKKLIQVRNDKFAWEKLKNSPVEGDEYKDGNYENREEVLISLQFYQEDSDEELIKFLFEEEIKDRNNDPFQGNTESLNRAGYLLATFKKPEYVWLFLNAKNANFDTHCGFDWEHILSAGVARTFDFIENSEEPQKEHFYDFFSSREDCELSENDIIEWHLNKASHFPKNPDDDDFEFWIDIALDLSKVEEVKRLIREIEAKSNNDEGSLRMLKYYKESVHDYDGQIAIIKVLVENPVHEHNIISDYLELSKVYLKNGQALESWNTIQKALKECDLSNVYTRGLFSEQAVEIIMKAESGLSDFTITETYKFAVNNYGNILPLATLEKYYKCAQKMEDEANEKLFYKGYLDTKKMLDDLKKSIE